MLIVSAAHFTTCPKCGQHGFIVASDGSRSCMCIAIDEALSVARGMQSIGVISDDEMPELIRQINESGLPKSKEAVMEAFQSMPIEEMIDFLKRSIAELGMTNEISERAADTQRRQFNERLEQLRSCGDPNHKTLH